jgi:hypothetical protein
MFRHLMLAFALLALSSVSSLAQNSDSQNKSFDVQSSVGDLHLGEDADARKAGLPLYPGARLKTGDDKEGDSNRANLSLFTEAFGFKLVVAKYDSEDAPAKVIDFYRDKLKRYGKVVECHSQKHGGDDVDVNDDDKDSSKNKPLKCEGNNTGPVTELKVGTEDDQHIVAVEPSDAGKGSTFALVYVHARGKKGEI